MMHRVLTFVMTLLLCCNASADNSRNVLVIHSFHQGQEWTDHITQGIQSVFAPFKQEIRLQFQYLDSQWDAGNTYDQELGKLIALKMAATPFDVVMASGDQALQFTRRHDIHAASGAPLVFCAVDSPMPPDAPAIGVFAHIDHQATLNLMLALHPACRRIVVLPDGAFTHDTAADELEKALTPIRQQVAVEIWPIGDPAGLPARLVGLDSQDLVYLLAGAPAKRADASNETDIVPLVVRWSPVPVYSCLDYDFGKGIVGGMITSGFNQGEHAARLALRILSDQQLPQSPAELGNPNQYMFDGRVLQRFQIEESRLPAGSVIIHPLPSLWVRRGFLLLVIAAALFLINAYLVLRLIGQKKKQRTLTRTNAELDGRFREKSAHLQLVNQKLKKQALIDDLTGLPNRRYVYQRFVEEAKKAQRYSQPLAILLINVDGFKYIHDKHGYVLAERVLRDVGQAIKRNVREIDLVGRYGGESFLVILPNTDQGRCAADRIRKTVLSLQWEQGEQKVTLSGGLAQMDTQSPAELIGIAEKRLELAKAQGGNRIVAAEADDAAGMM